MGFTLGINLSSLTAHRLLSNSTDNLSRVLQQLSSGQRINRPSDDAAGLAVSTTLRTNSRVFSQGILNINDGISALNLADSSLSQLSGILMRQRELAEQAANGTLSVLQRQSLNTESTLLTTEFNRIIAETKFNNLQLLKGQLGNLRIQGDFGINGGINYNIGYALSRGVGNGTFSAASTLNTGGASTTGAGALLVDIDGDGKLDLLSVSQASAGTSAISLQIGRGDGTFKTATTVASGANFTFRSLTAGDFNGDGRADLAFIEGDTGFGQDNIRLLINDGSGGLTSTVSSALGAINSMSSMSAGDFNNDGKMDIVVTASAGVVNTYSYPGTGNAVQLKSSISLGSGYGGDVAVYDMNGDGLQDIVAQDKTTTYKVLLGNGTFSFTSGSSISVGGVFTQLAAADLNRDGYGDVVTVGAATGVDMFLGNSSNTFSTNSISASGSSYLMIADMNGDGLLDIVSDRATNGKDYNAFIGDGLGNYNTRWDISLGSQVSNTQFALGDINGDGSIDIITSDTSAGAKSGNYISYQGSTRSTDSMYVNLTTAAGAREALDMLARMMDYISSEHGALGSTLSRLSSFLETLNSKREQTDAADSRISDVDMAAETANLIRLQILQNGATNIMSHINSESSIVLDLLT